MAAETKVYKDDEYIQPIVHQPMLSDADAEQVRDAPTAPFEAAGYVVESLEWNNPPALRTRFAFPWTDVANARLEEFRNRYDFLRVIEGIDNELEQMVALREWVRRRIPRGSPVKSDVDIFSILDLSASGGTFYCSHYAMVLQAVFVACGWTARHIGIDCDHTCDEPSEHHGVVDVFNNDLGKWMAIDAKHNVYFEKNSVPLSPWELSCLSAADGGQEVDICLGPDRKKHTIEQIEGMDSWREYRPGEYFWCRQPMHCDPFSGIGSAVPPLALVLVGDQHEGKDWYQGKPPDTHIHNGYRHGSFQFTRRYADVYPDIGTSELSLGETSAANAVKVSVATLTPNLDTVMIRVDDGLAGPAGEEFDWYLHEGANELTVQTRNKFGRVGKVSSVKTVLKKAPADKDA
ncbi:MAG: transglutaminase domain-containing protein [Planctomycetes bacterium]|nr:transglutaminase domain-containing protein [Planctomycetota bacterium]